MPRSHHKLGRALATLRNSGHADGDPPGRPGSGLVGCILFAAVQLGAWVCKPGSSPADGDTLPSSQRLLFVPLADAAPACQSSYTCLFLERLPYSCQTQGHQRQKGWIGREPRLGLYLLSGVHMCVCVHACVHKWMCIHVCMHMCGCACRQAHLCTCTCACSVCAHVYTYLCALCVSACLYK